jgi:hypothetical protein
MYMHVYVSVYVVRIMTVRIQEPRSCKECLYVRMYVCHVYIYTYDMYVRDINVVVKMYVCKYACV